MRWSLSGLCGVLAMMLAMPVFADIDVPHLSRQVTDLTGTLTSEQANAFEQSLAALEQRKGSQVAVLIVPTTQPETIEQYSIRVVEQWKLGRKGVDDGVLLLVAKDDHKVRIEVGYGLEGVINDATAKRIVAEDIVPAFRKSDFQAGIAVGIERITALIDGEALPAPQKKEKMSDDLESVLMLGFFLVVFLGGLFRSLFGRMLGSSLVGVITGLLAWALSGLLVAMVAGFLAFFFALFWGSVGSGGYFGSGGSSGGGSLGGGGGGFSGGGGGFGGGGASGQW
ncbi:YgcG family protein [Candidatus Methylospira mobilis]|uniref:YgcG family protein n=2 Tax=Candidatus Methylospira mobilis TaxID=1808979 RepID=A0A5Q0BRY0_9GAMM|nr:YgcG family protein [Candidatus Methylospira mobilis]